MYGDCELEFGSKGQNDIDGHARKSRGKRNKRRILTVALVSISVEVPTRPLIHIDTYKE